MTNYHTHSCFCDGKGEPREYVEYAVAHGFTALGFSGHSPLPYDNSFSIKDYESYCNEVRALKAEFADRIDIRLGLEIDYVPGLLEDFTPLVETGGLEYTIGSVHLIPNPDDVESLRQLSESAQGEERKKIPYHLWMIDGPRQETYDNGLKHIFKGDIKAGVRAYFHQQNEMILRNRPTIVGHPDKILMHNRERYFSSSDRWYRDLFYETLDLIHETGCICELNTRGIYKGRHPDYYPSREHLRHMDSLGIPLIVSTDAHQPTELDHFENAFELLQSIHYHNIVTTL